MNKIFYNYENGSAKVFSNIYYVSNTVFAFTSNNKNMFILFKLFMSSGRFPSLCELQNEKRFYSDQNEKIYE